MKFTQFVKTFRDDNPDLNMSFKDCMQSDVIKNAYKEIVGGNLAAKPAQWAQSKPVQQTQPVQHEHLTRGEWKAPIQRNSTNPKKGQGRPSSRCPPCSSRKDKKEGVQIIINNNGGGGGGSEEISVGRNGVRGPGPGGPRGPPRLKKDGPKPMEGLEEFDIFGNPRNRDQEEQDAKDRAADPGNQMQTYEREEQEMKARADADAKLKKQAAETQVQIDANKLKEGGFDALKLQAADRELEESKMHIDGQTTQQTSKPARTQEQQLIPQPERQVTAQPPANIKTANDERENFFKAFEAFKTLSESPYANFLGLHGNMYPPSGNFMYPNMMPPSNKALQDDDSKNNDKIKELEKTVLDLKDQLQLTKETQQQQAKISDNEKQIARQRQNIKYKEKTPPTDPRVVVGSPVKIQKNEVDGRAANDAVDSNQLILYDQIFNPDPEIVKLEDDIQKIIDSASKTKNRNQFNDVLIDYNNYLSQFLNEKPQYSNEQLIKTLTLTKKALEDKFNKLDPYM